MKLSRLRGANNEGVLVAVLLGLMIIMTIVNPSFLNFSTIFSVIRSSLVPMVMALAVLMIIISGGIDVSFPAIAIFSAYTTITLGVKGGVDLGLILVLAIALFFGAVLGVINGVVISRWRLPTLIVTLGTSGIFKGVLLAYVGSKYIADLPTALDKLSGTHLLAIPTGQGTAYLHLFIVPVALLCLLVWWILNKTMFGRSLYAIGGDFEAAHRAGFPVVRNQILLYVFAGVLAALAGVIHITMSRNANPQDLLGTELDIIAAVVLGGASVFGGRGSVFGTILGVFLIQFINNTLILMGIPSTWQRASIGLLLVIGVAIQAVSAKRASRKVFTIADAEEVA